MSLRNLLIQFIPILLVVFFFLYTKQSVDFSHTIIGKLIAVAIVVFYTMEDVYHGGLICSIIILYYLLTQPDRSHSLEGFETPDVHEDAKATFRDNHCIDGKLKYKNMDVKVDYVDMIFEEVKFTNSPCNPCDKTCSFSIIEEKLKTEDTLVRPKASNDEWTNLAVAAHEEHISNIDEPLETGDVFSDNWASYE